MEMPGQEPSCVFLLANSAAPYMRHKKCSVSSQQKHGARMSDGRWGSALKDRFYDYPGES
jgi:hypothetical protein